MLSGGHSLRIVATLLIVGVAVALGGSLTAAGAPERETVATACTKAQKTTRTKALAAYKKLMPKQRRAYFKRVKSAKKRKAFVRKQEAKLKKLKTAAGCRVVTPRSPSPPAPSPPTVTPPLPPIPPPAAPAETTPPTLTSATVLGTALTLGFDEPIASVTGAGVTADGLPVDVAGTAVAGTTVVLTLAAATDGGDVVLVNGSFRDAVGNPATLVSQRGHEPGRAWVLADARQGELGRRPHRVVPRVRRVADRPQLLHVADPRPHGDAVRRLPEQAALVRAAAGVRRLGSDRDDVVQEGVVRAL